MGGGWQCLYGCYCRSGVSIEWHDFQCDRPRDWARSFHPGGVEVCLNLSGHARLTCGQEALLLGPKTAGCYFAGNGGLSAWRLPGERHQFLTVEYSREFLSRQLTGHEQSLLPLARRALGQPVGAACLSAVSHLGGELKRLAESLRAPAVSGPALGVWYQGKALELMAEFFFALPDQTPPATRRQKHLAQQRVAKVIEILGRQLAEPPTLEELGRAVGCSPYHLSRTFSREMGLTIPQYLRQVRMERAAELLKSGLCNVTEAALEVGYSSLSHFSHAFCEVMGCCPGLYPLGLMRPQLRAASSGATSGSAIRRQ